MKELAKQIIKKYKEGGEVDDWKQDLDAQVEGMSSEAKEYLLEKLKGEDVGKAEDEYVEEDREELDKELAGMSDVGKEELEKDIHEEDPWAGVRAEMAKGGEASVLKEAAKVGHDIRKDDPMWDRKGIAKKTGKEIERDQGPKMAKGGAIHKPVHVSPQDVLRTKKEDKNWIQGAVKKPGALRASAKKEGLIEGDEKLSKEDLQKLAAQAKKSGNKLLSKRVSLAKTFAKMRKS